ncbi:CoB--CoM heterodisulfide reductase iron-sulfur subunit B family protein, partial [Chloroflexota bacterium]
KVRGRVDNRLESVNRSMTKKPVYAYYPGCSLETTAREYDASTKLVCRALGIELREIEDWTCCGASSAHSVSHLLGIALPARNLQIAEEMGLPMAVPCPACSSRLKFASHDLEDGNALGTVNQILGKEFANGAVVEPMLKILADEGLPLAVKKPLSGLKVACYYGCMLVRPRAILDFDDEENPQTMDRLVERLGAEALDWPFKTDCCGAGMPLARPDMVRRLSHSLLSAAKRLGADSVAVACPMCQSNLDMQQGDIEKEYNEKLGLPVVYFTQLMGLALGIPAGDLLLDKHFVSPLPMLRERGLD